MVFKDFSFSLFLFFFSFILFFPQVGNKYQLHISITFSASDLKRSDLALAKN